MGHGIGQKTTGKGIHRYGRRPSETKVEAGEHGGVPDKFKWEREVGRQQVIKLASS